MAKPKKAASKQKPKKTALRKPTDKTASAAKDDKPAKENPPPKEQIDKETGADMRPIRRWIQELRDTKKAWQPFWDKCDKIQRRYAELDRDSMDENAKKKRRYSALWSMMQTLMPLTYSTPPRPFATRRFSYDDQVANDAAEILQDGLTYEVDSESIHDTLDECNEDFNLASIGVTWVRYLPMFALRESEIKEYYDDEEDLPEDQNTYKLGVDEEGNFFVKTFQQKIDEAVGYDHVNFSDFMHGFASKWKHVPWVACRVPMTRQELIDRFKEKGKMPPLTLAVADGKDKSKDDDEKGMFAKAEVWEVWHKRKRQVMWICPEWDGDFLDIQDDPLELEDFYPCPRPAYGTKTNKSLIPTPDYLLWQDIALELDQVTHRIYLLTKALRVVGAYNKEAGEAIKRITSQTDDNDMIPVDNWAMFEEKGGLKGQIEYFPIDTVMTVLDKLGQRRQMLVQELYEITGVSDIIRGASDPNETAAAQQLKGNYANKRLGKRQDKFARMVRESLEIMSQIICTQYSDDTLLRISDAQAWMKTPEGAFDEKRWQSAIKLLRTGMLRRFRVKIDERSLAAQDLQQDREEKMQFLQSISQFLTAAVPLLQQYPSAKGMVKELLLFGVRAFPLARTTEASIDAALDQFMSGQQAPQEKDAPAGPQGKSPAELAVEQGKVQVAQARVEVLDRQRQDRAQAEQANQALRTRELDIKEKANDDDAAIRANKVTADAVLKADATAQTREQMQVNANAEKQRLQRDVQNDAMNAAQAFARPPTSPDPRAARQPAYTN